MKMKRILVVDDEPHILRLIEVNLERAGYAVDSAFTGARALPLIRQNPPDLVVTDLIMPEMDGFELVANIRRDSTLPHMPIILLASEPQDWDPVWGPGHGANAFLSKPFHPSDLVATVRRLVSRDDGPGGGAAPAGVPLPPAPTARPAKDAKKRPEWWEA